MASTNSKIDQLRVNIQGSLTPVKVGTFGAFSHGKSSLITSLDAALHNRYEKRAPVSSGGNPKTTQWLKYVLTTNFDMYDNRGFGALCGIFNCGITKNIAEQTMKEIAKEISGKRANESVIEWQKGFWATLGDLLFSGNGEIINCPIIVWKGNSPETPVNVVKTLTEVIKKHTGMCRMLDPKVRN